jgi:hypothetical protein
MFKPCTILPALIAVLTVAGCVSQSQFLDSKQAAVGDLVEVT